jgi:hypothetical protein
VTDKSTLLYTTLTFIVHTQTPPLARKMNRYVPSKPFPEKYYSFFLYPGLNTANTSFSFFPTVKSQITGRLLKFSKQLDIVMHAYSLSTGEAETKGS